MAFAQAVAQAVALAVAIGRLCYASPQPFSSSPSAPSVVAEKSPPTLSVPSQLQHAVDEPTEFSLLASDSDDDTLTFSATVLPDGVSLSADGVLRDGAVSYVYFVAFTCNSYCGHVASADPTEAKLN